jgi:hypothetical protein
MRQQIRYWFVVVLALAALAAQAQVSWPTRGWDTATPESQGMASRASPSNSACCPAPTCPW